MFGLSGNGDLFALVIAIALWCRFFVRQGRLSILSLLVLMALVAIWLVAFRPFQPGIF
jgi:hypothetical protein